VGLSLHDSISRRKVPLAPAEPTRVTVYTCGPTVYRNVHIGNLRTYLLTDLLVRTLRFLGYGTFSAQNITDMGHMHQEQLELGEDKVIAAARALATAWDAVLGVGLLSEADGDSEVGGILEGEAGKIPVEVEAMGRERDARRRARDYPAADALRERIRAAGYDVVDAEKGTTTIRKTRGTRER